MDKIYKLTIESADEEDIRRVANASSMAAALWDVRNMIRRHDKYGGYDQDETAEVVDKIYEEFYTILSDNGLDLDSLIS